MPRHLLDLLELSPAEAESLLSLAHRLKTSPTRPQVLAGRTLGLIFEKPSLRTRVSFEASIAQLGGNALFLKSEDVGLGGRETMADFARVISQYLDVLAVRVFKHETATELARYSSIPVINALSDEAHPCQALADLLTVDEELGGRAGRRLVFVGDGNNVARSLAIACAQLGVDFVLSGPPAYDFPDSFREQFRRAFPGESLKYESDPARAVAGADAVYTDVWTSMGQEEESSIREREFQPYQVNEALMKRAKPEAIFLHCLPAKRGQEVTDGVMDGPQSRVFPQAANRLHLQKALLVWQLGLEGFLR